MKKRKFADGGETTEMMPSAKPEGGRFDKDTYARARRFVESGGEKEETKTAVKKARKVETKPSASDESSYKDTSSRFPSKYEEAPVSRASSGSRAGPTIERAAKMARDKAAEDEMMRPGRDAIEGVYPETMLLGGGLRSLMGRKGAAEAAGSTERGLATYETPITFTGRSGAKNMTPLERLAERKVPRLEMGAAKIEQKAGDAGRLTKAEAKPSAPRQITNKAEEKSSPAKNRQMPKKEDFGAAKKPDRTRFNEDEGDVEFGRGGKVKKYASGGSVSSASSRGDGIAQRGKTKGKVC